MPPIFKILVSTPHNYPLIFIDPRFSGQIRLCQQPKAQHALPPDQDFYLLRSYVPIFDRLKEQNIIASSLHFFESPVNLLDICKYNFGIQSAIFYHIVHIITRYEVRNARQPLPSMEGQLKVLFPIFW